MYIIKRKFKCLSWIWLLFHLVKWKNVYFIRTFGTHKKYIFFTSLDEIRVIFTPKHLNILYIYIYFRILNTIFCNIHAYFLTNCHSATISCLSNYHYNQLCRRINCLYKGDWLYLIVLYQWGADIARIHSRMTDYVGLWWRVMLLLQYLSNVCSRIVWLQLLKKIERCLCCVIKAFYFGVESWRFKPISDHSLTSLCSSISEWVTLRGKLKDAKTEHKAPIWKFWQIERERERERESKSFAVIVQLL